MATFSLDSDFNAVDWRILQNGAISLYFRLGVLAEDIDWLREHGYIVHEFDCAGWISDVEMHRDLSVALEFESYYGENLDALHDCLSDIVVSDDGGVALAFQSFDEFARRSPRTAQVLLDILQDNSRWHLLFGRRFIALAQSSDPELAFDRVGSCPVTWNRREALRAKRGL
jgi:RNAse (barnase) inhibitor barstar